MKKTLLATVSAVSVALAGATPVVAQNADRSDLMGALKSIEQMDEAQLEELMKLCEAKGKLPGKLSCDDVSARLAAMGGGQDPAAEPQGEQQNAAEAPAEPADAPQAAEAPAEPAPTEAPQAAEAPADPAPAEAPQAAETPAAEAAPQAPVAEAPAEPAPQQTETAANPERGAPAASAEDIADALKKKEQDAAAAEATPPAPEGEPVQTTNAEDIENRIRELTAQEQADAVADNNGRPAAAAAAAAGTEGGNEPQMTEETVSEEDVRRSTEDFVTNVLNATNRDGTTRIPVTGDAKAEDRDDNDTAKTLAGAALLGLGAVALADILGDNEKVVSNSGDRVVIEDNGQLRVLRNDDALLRRPGADVQTYRYDDGSTRNVVTYEDGTSVETIRAADGRVLRRTRTLTDGTEVVLFDDTQETEQVVVNQLPQTTDRTTVNFRDVQADELAAALAAKEPETVNRRFSLAQVRNIDAVRRLVPEISVDTINFQTNSAAIRAEEAEELAALGNAMRDMIERNPGEVFLIEGHTDAVGQYSYNLALSDRRAESVALALTEYFQVPPENMVLQGYGESDLLVETPEAERVNRRAAVRRITPLLN
ncbi:OmpA family protein [Tropicibacter sp. S64]|uniref:OmpA family protein n=1 Tax=Tropicibacter sp. S64 TaxID=3415122 RepID=UPI003C7AD846